MSLPAFSPQGELFSTAGFSASLFAETDRYRLFAKLVYPHLGRARARLEKCYCADNGRVALEPVLPLGASIRQDLDGVSDRQAVEMLRSHAGWDFALNRRLGDAVFHPSNLLNFRQRLQEHEQSALGFATVLDALIEAGLVSRQSRQRLVGFKALVAETVSEVVRGHGLRRARSGGAATAKLQNYFIGAVCNVKRWIRREAWKLRQAALALAAAVVSDDAAAGAAAAVN